jgi:hypothetical protein
VQRGIAGAAPGPIGGRPYGTPVSGRETATSALRRRPASRDELGNKSLARNEPIGIAGRIEIVAPSNGRELIDRTPTGRGDLARYGRWLAICIAAVIGQREARAEPCPPASPACHLDNGKQLLRSDPRRAADELLASYQLDERTDTLVLYATALALDHRYALALETWKRVIIFRDSEVETAKETARTTSSGRRRADARATRARAEKQSAEAADALLELWTKVGYVRIRVAPGQRFAVTRDGAEVDLAQDVVVNAGRDELVFTGDDGRVERVIVEVAAGGLAKIDAPSDQRARPALAATPQRAPSPKIAAAPPKIAAAQPTQPVTESARPAPEPPPRVPSPAAAAAAQPPIESTVTAEREVDAPRSLTLSRVGLGLTAGAVAVGGVAASFAYLAHRDFDQAQSAGCSADGRCPLGPAADLARQSNHPARVAQLSAIGAGVLGATGVTLWFVGHRNTHHRVTDVALRVGPSPTAMSGAISGSF